MMREVRQTTAVKGRDWLMCLLSCGHFAIVKSQGWYPPKRAFCEYCKDEGE